MESLGNAVCMENEGLRQEKRNEFLKKYGGVVFAPIVAFALYFFQLIFNGVYPFGNGDYTVASYDLSAQICPFIEHLFDVLDGESTLFYSYKLAGGMDVFGTFAYFFISPFSFLFLLFGDGNAYNAAGIVMALKLALIAFSGAWFCKKLFQNIPSALGGAIGVLYAFCGYTFVANTYINWVDFLIYSPLCAVAFVRFCKTGKFLAFSILVAACVYTCFSIACFAMLTVFPVLVFYALLCRKKEEKLPFIAYLCLSFACAILLSLPVLIPSLSAFLNAGRGGDLFSDFWYGFSELHDGRFVAKEYYERAGTAWYRKFSYLLSDSVFFVFTLIYFLREGVKSPFSKFMLIAGVYTLIPVIVDESMLLLNMGSYMSYALRFGFLNALYFMGGACLAFEGLYREHKERESTLLSEKKTAKKGLYLYFAVSLVVAVLLTAFLASDLYVSIWEKVFSDSAAISDAKSFSSMYAHSLGGLQTIAVIFLLVAVACVLGWIMVKRRKLGVRAMSLILFAVACVPTVFYSEQLVVGNLSTHYNFDHYKTMAKVLDGLEEGGYYRIKDYEDKLTANAPTTGDGAAVSAFSSMLDGDNFACAELFGYWGNGKNSMKSTGGNKFGDAFLGYKYFYVTVDKAEKVEALSYVEPVSYRTENGEEKKTLQAGSFYMYENKSVFPLAYTVQGGAFRMPLPQSIAARSKNQRALYDYLNGTKYEQGSDKVTASMVDTLSIKLWQRAANIEVGKGKIHAEVTAKKGENLFLAFVATDGYVAKVNGKRVKLCDNDLNMLCVPLEEGENVVELEYRSPYPKQIAWSTAVAVLVFLGAALALKKTKIMKKIEKPLAWAGILLAIGVTAFFFVFPTAVFLGKVGLSAWRAVF